MKMKRPEALGIRFSRIAIVFMCFLFVLNVIWPDKAQSPQENRSLQTFPKFSLEDLQSGTFAKNLDSWFADQFVGRHSFIHFKYWVQKLSGNRKIDNVFLARGGLIEDVSEPNKEQFDRNLEAISNFYSDHNIQTTFVLAPTAANIHKDRLPMGATTRNQDKQIDTVYKNISNSITKVDLREILREHKDEYLYYRTDHHWTTLGAYYAFEELNNVMDYGNISQEDYTVYPVANKFTGTLANKTGSTNISDEIDIYVPKEEIEYIVTNQSTGQKSRTVYHSDALETNDPYTVFFEGNSGLIKIETNIKSDKHLLVIKDSYANALIPFLIPHYRTITIVDPRYYFDDIQMRLDMDLINEVMYIYNSNTFVTDTSLADMLESAGSQEQQEEQ